MVNLENRTRIHYIYRIKKLLEKEESKEINPDWYNKERKLIDDLTQRIKTDLNIKGEIEPENIGNFFWRLDFLIQLGSKRRDSERYIEIKK